MIEQTTTNTVWQAGNIVDSYAAPLKRQWTSLTNEDRLVIDNEYINELGSVEHFKAVEEKLRELNQ